MTGVMDNITQATPETQSASTEASTEQSAAATTAAPASTEAPSAVEPVSTTAEKPPEAKPEDDPKFARAFGALSRKEKAIREREAALKAQEQQLSGLAKLSETAKSDPLKALEALGLSYEDLTEAVLRHGQEPTADDRVAQLEKKLREREEAEEKARNEAQLRAQQEQIAQGKAAVTNFVKQQGEKFELICAEEAFDDVWGVLSGYFEQHGEVLPLEEAAEHVERELEARAERILKAKKIASRVKPPEPPKSDESSPRANGATTTLTNSSVSEAPILSDEKLPLDPEERNRVLLSRMRLWE